MVPSYFQIVLCSQVREGNDGTNKVTSMRTLAMGTGDAGAEIQLHIWELVDQLASKMGRPRPLGCIQQPNQPQQVGHEFSCLTNALGDCGMVIAEWKSPHEPVHIPHANANLHAMHQPGPMILQ